MNKHVKTVWCGKTPEDVLVETVPGKEEWKIIPASVNRDRALELLLALQDALGERDAYLKGEPDESADTD